MHTHLDALCTIADSQDGAATCAELFSNQARWGAFSMPGPELARAAAHDEPGCLLVQGVGVIASGEGLDELEQRLSSMEAAAARRLASRLGPSRPAERGVPAPDDVETILLNARGQASGLHRVVLSVEASMRAIADRVDRQRIADAARRIEMVLPWAPDLGGELVAGVGLVTSGRDEAEARAVGAAAAHAHRVAAALIDTSDRTVPVPEPDWAPTALPTNDAETPFRGRIFIVTGAASGIGRDIARHLAGQGAQLGLGDLNAPGLDIVADELEHFAGRPVVVAGDLTDPGTVDLLVRSTVLRFGGLDGAVLNAGVAMPGQIQDLSVADWRRSLEVNATSHFLLAKRLLPALGAQGLGGSLVFIGSKNMFSPGAGFGAYSASKAALAQLARVVAIEAGPLKIRSNIVNPDNVFAGSALWSPELRAQRAAVYGIAPQDLEAYYTQRNLMKVPISGHDIAKATAFLLSDDAERTTACVLTVDGGVPGVFPR
ncbi:MAG: SDR family oxidoreductase [Candidatus Limnocylindrales bacterium]